MEIRKSLVSDIDEIMPLFAMARKTMAALGIDQWQNGYPFRENIEEDAANGESYVVTTDDGRICGTFMLMKRNEPTYDKILDGEWIEKSESYATIHRITVEPSMRQTGDKSCGVSVSRMIVDYAKAFARTNGLPSVKVDTHRGNIAMRKMLEKNGFVHCGTILLASGEERVAYQFVI